MTKIILAAYVVVLASTGAYAQSSRAPKQAQTATIRVSKTGQVSA
jgi:hypothetical protein